MKKLLFLGVFLGAVGFIQAAQAQSYTFTRDLSVGATGSDVSALQDVLIQSGFNIPSISSGFVPKGYFGAQTRAAIVAYQSANGIPGTGYVGPLTRGRLNGSVVGNALRILSPNGNETLQKGTSYSIRWSASQGLSNKTGSLWLSFYTPPCAEPSNAIRCMIAVRAPVLIAQNINLASGAYTWTVGNVNENLACTANGYCPLDWTPVAEGQYKIQICNSNSVGDGVCDSSDGYFSITSGNTSSSKPVINGLDAPTSLTINQTGTWTVRATDPQNQSLRYSVDWGETKDCPSGYVCDTLLMSPPSQTQTSTFSHSYSRVGVYTVTFTVTNSSGQLAQTSSTVTVTNLNSPSSLKVLSPSAGDILYRNTPYVIRWTSPAYFRATYADIRLIRDYQCANGYVCPAIAYAPMTIATNVSINQNSYTWNVGMVTDYMNQTQSAQDGEYTIQICETGTSNCASSGKFTISPVNSSVPDINVISPNGGEFWTAGTNNTVSVQFSGNQSQMGNLITLALVDSNNQSFNLGEFSRIGTGVQSFPVSINGALTGGPYRIYAALYTSGVSCLAIGCPPAPRTMQAYDYSDNTFNILTYSVIPPIRPYDHYACPVGYVCSPVN